jgi:aspartyl-tRNA(Asn)/glutamyl-tRNA(Gln) amidotransferase subunit B
VLGGEGSPAAVAESRDLIQISDTGALEAAVSEVVAANPQAVDAFRNGEEKVLGFLIGQVMKATQGRADPKLADQLLRARLRG